MRLINALTSYFKQHFFSSIILKQQSKYISMYITGVYDKNPLNVYMQTKCVQNRLNNSPLFSLINVENNDSVLNPFILWTISFDNKFRTSFFKACERCRIGYRMGCFWEYRSCCSWEYRSCCSWGYRYTRIWSRWDHPLRRYCTNDLSSVLQ